MTRTFADTSATISTTVTVSSSCSLYGNNTIPHTASIFVGHEETDIGNTNMAVECNDGSGSKVYAVGFSNDTLKNTNMVDTSTNNVIPTGTGTGSSNWSMKLSIPSGNTAPTIRSDATYDFTDYEVIPNDYALVASFQSGSDGVNNSSFSVTYRAYINGAQAPGSYTGKVKYVLVHPNESVAPSVYTVTYADASNEATGLPAAQIGDVISAANATLSSTEPTRDGYIFIGWCSVDNSSDTTSCSGTTYEGGDTYAITNSGSATNVTLYAIWERDVLYMQNMTLQDCQVNVGIGSNASGVGDNIIVYDRRKSNYISGDEGDYTARWINGQCWMTQNLRVSGVLSASLSNFSGNDFNVSEYDFYGNSNSGKPCGLDTNFSGEAYSNVCMHLADSGDISTLASRGAILTIKQAGAWYNFAAASAGTVRGDSNSNAVTGDICPAGWRLPTGTPQTAGTDFNQLAGNYTLNGSAIDPTTTGLNAFGAVMASYYFGCVQYLRGEWWSSTANDVSARYILNYQDDSKFTKGYSELRSTGISIRCVMIDD